MAATRRSTKKETPAPIFQRVRDYISRYVILGGAALDIVTTWIVGTWTFSPSCVQPATYPYLYITGSKGSGKTLLGQDICGDLCRLHQSTVGITGPGVFRLMGEIDEESGSIIATAPTLSLDEIDATYSGAKDEKLRQMLNAGYKYGATVPRSFGKQTFLFPVYSPKILMGIDNGHLPETVTDRSIRIDMRKATNDELAVAKIEERFAFDIAEESAELQQQLSDWAKDNSLTLREYRPDREKSAGLSARQWEISRSLVQLGHALGIENRIRAGLDELMARRPERPDAKVRLYKAIFELFEELDEDRLTTRQILSRLTREEVQVPGQSGMGLAAVLSEEGIAPDMIRLPNGHAGIEPGRSLTQRGYWRHKFDGAFSRHLAMQDDE